MDAANSKCWLKYALKIVHAKKLQKAKKIEATFSKKMLI